MSREAMDRPPRLKDGRIVGSNAVVCIGRFGPPEEQRFEVQEPFRSLLGLHGLFATREAALEAILESDRSRS